MMSTAVVSVVESPTMVAMTADETMSRSNRFQPFRIKFIVPSVYTLRMTSMEKTMTKT